LDQSEGDPNTIILNRQIGVLPHFSSNSAAYATIYTKLFGQTIFHQAHLSEIENVELLMAEMMKSPRLFIGGVVNS
jgi:hypothetical protein